MPNDRELSAAATLDVLKIWLDRDKAVVLSEGENRIEFAPSNQGFWRLVSDIRFIDQCEIVISEETGRVTVRYLARAWALALAVLFWHPVFHWVVGELQSLADFGTVLLDAAIFSMCSSLIVWWLLHRRLRKVVRGDRQ